MARWTQKSGVLSPLLDDKSSMQVVDYDVLRQPTIADLRDQVRDAISAGYQPLGGICVDRVGAYFQAVVKMSAGTIESDEKSES